MVTTLMSGDRPKLIQTCMMFSLSTSNEKLEGDIPVIRQGIKSFENMAQKNPLNEGIVGDLELQKRSYVIKNGDKLE